MAEAERGYEIAPYRPELKPQLLKLQTGLWSPDVALNAAYFEWKYERNPYMTTTLVFVALHAGEVVGMRGFSGGRWDAGGGSFLVPFADDLVIHPEHRSRGLIAKIMSAAFEDLAAREFSHVVNLSAGPITYVASFSMGWRSPGSLQMWGRGSGKPAWVRRSIASVKSLPLIWRLATHPPLVLRKLERVGFSGLEGARKRVQGIAHVRVEDAPRSEAMSDLVGRLGSDGRIRHERDAKYFAWRFQNPLSRYRYIYWEDTRLEGYLVLQMPVSRLAERTQVQIVDWEASDARVREDLLLAADQLLSKAPTRTWTATLPEEARSLLGKHGFRAPASQGGVEHARPAILVKAVRGTQDWKLGGRSLLDMSEWDIRLLYSMHG